METSSLLTVRARSVSDGRSGPVADAPGSDEVIPARVLTFLDAASAGVVRNSIRIVHSGI